MSRRMFWLYRPTAPSVRAQSLQSVFAAHASAARGHRVTLCVQATTGGMPENGAPITVGRVLRYYGLEPLPTLDLYVLPAGNTAASLAFRARFAEWLLRGGGVVVARSKRYAAEALRRAGGRFELIIEAHEVDSLLVEEAGEDSSPTRALEQEVLGAARGVICNCEGTRDLLVGAHPQAPPSAVLHNAADPSRVRHPSGRGRDVGYVGSLRSAKDPGVLADAARLRQRDLVMVGAGEDDGLGARGGGWLRFEPSLPPTAVPDRMAAFSVLVLPVGGGLFGERLTSPLKLWDYLGVGRPIAAADTPALRAAAGDAAAWYPVGDGAALAELLDRLAADAPTRATLVDAARARFRTWADRAAELDGFFEELGL